MAHLFVKFLPAMDFSGPYKGNFDMKLGFSGLSDDFKFGHKLKHLEFKWTIEEGSLNDVVDNTTREIMMLLCKFPVFVSLFDRNNAVQWRKIILFVQNTIGLWFKIYQQSCIHWTFLFFETLKNHQICQKFGKKYDEKPCSTSL